MMNASTQDFAHRVAIILAGILIGGAFVYIAIVNGVQGDGHALALAAQLQPYVMTGFGSLVGILGINSVASAFVAVKTAQASAGASQPEVAATLANTAAQAVPAAAQAGISTPDMSTGGSVTTGAAVAQGL